MCDKYSSESFGEVSLLLCHGLEMERFRREKIGSGSSAGHSSPSQKMIYSGSKCIAAGHWGPPLAII